mmetsp:Transcript_54165/g.105976  ORF Transcript_54165/g.105976 Transcript_54165/m.105976 type:complete len:129 (+) Transcript_54165:293-679(+)
MFGVSVVGQVQAAIGFLFSFLAPPFGDSLFLAAEVETSTVLFFEDLRRFRTAQTPFPSNWPSPSEAFPATTYPTPVAHPARLAPSWQKEDKKIGNLLPAQVRHQKKRDKERDSETGKKVPKERKKRHR